MDKSKKIPEELIDEVVGGFLYISMDGGAPLKAQVACIGGNLGYVVTDANNQTRLYKTDQRLDDSNPNAMLAYTGGRMVSKDKQMNLTLDFDSSDFEKVYEV